MEAVNLYDFQYFRCNYAKLACISYKFKLKSCGEKGKNASVVVNLRIQMHYIICHRDHQNTV